MIRKEFEALTVGSQVQAQLASDTECVLRTVACTSHTEKEKRLMLDGAICFTDGTGIYYGGRATPKGWTPWRKRIARSDMQVRQMAAYGCTWV